MLYLFKPNKIFNFVKKFQCINLKIFFLEIKKLLRKFLNFFNLIVNIKDFLIFEIKRNFNLEIIIKIFYKELVNIFIFSKKHGKFSLKNPFLCLFSFFIVQIFFPRF